MDTIDPQAKIPPPVLEKTPIMQKADEREPQRERPKYQRKKREDAPLPANSEEEEAGKKQLIDILV